MDLDFTINDVGKPQGQPAEPARTGLRSPAILVQCFNKPDTLKQLCESLLRCEGASSHHLIFWSDVPDPVRHGRRVFEQHEAVLQAIERFAAAHASRFASVELHRNDRNLGTCATCRTALDAAFARHPFVIFTEDDTVFSRDALRWFGSLLEAGQLDQPEVLALAGESIYFDSRSATLPDAYPEAARRAAEADGLVSRYVALSFLPSTCFATTAEKWRRFGALRGQPRGDEDVCALCREAGLEVIFPVVARVKDLGMLHPDGYSVGVLGADAVPEIKNTYLFADDLAGSDAPPLPFEGNMGRLFEQSVQLAGFAPAAPAILGPRPWQLWCFSLRNFGDALTPELLRRYGVPFELVNSVEEATLLGIGSNLDRVRPDKPITVWSSGFMYPKARPVRYGEAVRFLGVRGQRTRASIELPAPAELVLGDGGLLLALQPPTPTKRFALGILPHMSDVRAAVRLGLPDWPGVRMIDVLAPIDQVMADIAACRRIASSSLHGIVAADALGIPNLLARFAGGRDLEGDGFKYADYASALVYDIAEMEIDAAASRDTVIARIDALPARPPVPAALLRDLEMTLAILRGAMRGLCRV